MLPFFISREIHHRIFPTFQPSSLCFSFQQKKKWGEADPMGAADDWLEWIWKYFHVQYCGVLGACYGNSFCLCVAFSTLNFHRKSLMDSEHSTELLCTVDETENSTAKVLDILLQEIVQPTWIENVQRIRYSSPTRWTIPLFWFSTSSTESLSQSSFYFWFSCISVLQRVALWGFILRCSNHSRAGVSLAWLVENVKWLNRWRTSEKSWSRELSKFVWAYN